MQPQPKDFSNRQHFPGLTGNTFDTILRRAVGLQKIPSIVFGLILFVLAVIPHFSNLYFGTFLWFFMLTDWFFVASLPRSKKSYGPAKPPVLVLAFLRMLIGFLPIPYAVVFEIIGTALVLQGFWVEPLHVHLTHQVYRSPKLKLDTPLRVLHIGDIHVERITKRELELNQLIQSTEPDLIVFSGDFINLSYLLDPVAQSDVRKLISEWSAPLGVYAVTGSPAVDLPDMIPGLLQGLPICRLDNEKVDLKFHDETIELIGVTCTHKPFIDTPELQKLVGTQEDRPFTIFLYHSPDLAPEAAELGVDLQLSGHTHGGQVRLPFFGALLTGSLYGKAFEMGRKQIGNMVLYVTRGVGLEGQAAPRVRFLCPPEVILWEIQGV